MSVSRPAEGMGRFEFYICNNTGILPRTIRSCMEIVDDLRAVNVGLRSLTASGTFYLHMKSISLGNHKIIYQ